MSQHLIRRDFGRMQGIHLHLKELDREGRLKVLVGICRRIAYLRTIGKMGARTKSRKRKENSDGKNSSRVRD